MENDLEKDLMDALQGGEPEKDPVSTDLEEELAKTGNQEEPAKEEAPAEEPEKQDEPADEPAKQDEPAEEAPAEEPADEPAEEPKQEEQPLILGKFKTQKDLENAYTNLQKQFTKKSQEIPEMAKVNNPTEFDRMVNEEVSKAGWELVNNAMRTISNPENLKEATFELEQYRRTGDPAHLEKARGFLDPRVDRRLEVNFMNVSAEIRQKANEYRDEIELGPVAQALNELEQEDPDWLNDESHQNIIIEAIKLNRKVDVKGIKKLISAVEENAINRYKAKEAKKAVVKEERKPNVSVKSSERSEPPARKKDWREMSIEEQLEEAYKN